MWIKTKAIKRRPVTAINTFLPIEERYSVITPVIVLLLLADLSPGKKNGKNLTAHAN
jgi:hypothetical protein